MTAWIESNELAPPRSLVIDGFKMGSFWSHCCQGAHKTLFEAARTEAANFSSDGLQHMTAMAQTIGRRGGQHSQFMFKITTGDLMLKLLGHLAEYIKLPSHVLGHDVLYGPHWG